MKKIIFALFILLPLFTQAQYITGIGTTWDDAFTEWTIYSDDEAVQGELRARWAMREDWTQWDYYLGEEKGTATMPWKNDPTQWEFRGYDNEVITCRTKWKNDFSEWRITDNKTTLTLRSRWRDNMNEWIVVDREYGEFAVYTLWENDPREWEIFDELDEEISFNMKMAIVFISIYHSFPK